MTPEQRYLMDLQGYVVIKNAISNERLTQINNAMNKLEASEPNGYPHNVLLGKDRTENELYISNILEADPCFHSLIDHPQVIPIINEMSLGLYRLNHTYAIYRWGEGYTYMHMGGEPIHPKASYICKNGKMFSLLTKAVFPIKNTKKEDGCFAVIPGSHKSNFERPYGDHPSENPALVPVEAEPGDAIVFTEALTHGSFPNTSGKERRTIYFCYSVGYMPDWTKFGLTFSSKIVESVNNEQREILSLK